jgi:hypothetical protein
VKVSPFCREPPTKFINELFPSKVPAGFQGFLEVSSVRMSLLENLGGLEAFEVVRSSTHSEKLEACCSTELRRPCKDCVGLIPRESRSVQYCMGGRSIGMCTVLLALALVPSSALRAQAPPPPRQGEESTYGSRFFEQLRNIFGRFPDSDLRRLFQQSKPIDCSELVGRKGEWRAVAFFNFNEDRKLGDWCRESLDDVKSDLAVYTFKGTCTGGQESVNIGSEFPTAAGIEAYNSGRSRGTAVRRFHAVQDDPYEEVTIHPATQIGD